MVDAARGGCLALVTVGVSSWCPISRNSPIHRTIIKETIPKANLPPISSRRECRTPECSC